MADKGEEKMLYQATADEVKEFTRKARKVERMLQRKGGSEVNPVIALAKVDEIIASTTSAVELVSPEGCRIHIFRMPVVLDQPWQEAVREAGPNTPDNYNVWKVGDQYRPTGTGTKEAEIILLNYTRGGSFDKAIAWAMENRLKRTAPRHIFAVGKHKPQLHYELGINPMYVVATEECYFEGYRRACFVWWYDAKRRAFLDWVGSYGNSNDWFAFLRE